MDLSTEKNLGYLKDYFRYYESTNPGVKIELIELNCDNDVEQQINDIQTCIAMNLSLIHIFHFPVPDHYPAGAHPGSGQGTISGDRHLHHQDDQQQKP